MRYQVSYIPRTAVEAIVQRHKKAIERDDFSVWDFVEPEQLEVVVDLADEKTALGVAAKVVQEDEHGEVHVYEQEPCDGNGYRIWETIRSAVYQEHDLEFDWSPV